MNKQTYYKVVDVDMCSGNEEFIYKVGTWHHKETTRNKTSFFVFTDLNEAINYAKEYVCNYKIFECEVSEPAETDDELGHISSYKNNAVFADAVKLTKLVRQTELVKSGMVFRIKRTKQYLMAVQDKDSYTNIVYLDGKKRGCSRFQFYDDIDLDDLLSDNKDLVLVTEKVKITVTK